MPESEKAAKSETPYFFKSKAVSWDYFFLRSSFFAISEYLFGCFFARYFM